MGFSLGNILKGGITGFFSGGPTGAVVGAGLGLIASYEERRANRTAGNNRDISIQALDDAMRLIEDAHGQALGFLEQGNAQAAGEIIHAAKLASRHILEYGELSIAAQLEFYQIADEKLQPFVDQGLFANDEFASMLGIPNSKGELVDFDLNDLRETPGFQFQFETGTNAVENSAVGRQLSGRQVKEQQRFGDGLAQLYFGQRLNQLLPLISNGLSAADRQSTNALTAGANIGSTFENIGLNLANIDMFQGENLARLAESLGINKGNLATGLADQQSNLLLGGAAAEIQANNTRQQNRNDTFESVAGLIGTVAPLLTGGRPKTTPTTQGGGGQGINLSNPGGQGLLLENALVSQGISNRRSTTNPLARKRDDRKRGNLLTV